MKNLLNSYILKRPGLNNGFTLLEVVCVLVLLGILVAVAASRFSDAEADEVAEANILKAHLRYAQLRAMGDIVPWGINISSNQYTLQKDGSTAPVNLPGENSATRDGLQVSIGGYTGVISFSAARGRPRDSSGFLSSNQTINIGSQVISITPETGFIP